MAAAPNAYFTVNFGNIRTEEGLIVEDVIVGPHEIDIRAYIARDARSRGSRSQRHVR